MDVWRRASDVGALVRFLALTVGLIGLWRTLARLAPAFERLLNVFTLAVVPITQESVVQGLILDGSSSTPDVSDIESGLLLRC